MQGGLVNKGIFTILLGMIFSLAALAEKIEIIDKQKLISATSGYLTPYELNILKDPLCIKENTVENSLLFSFVLSGFRITKIVLDNSRFPLQYDVTLQLIDQNQDHRGFLFTCDAKWRLFNIGLLRR